MTSDQKPQFQREYCYRIRHVSLAAPAVRLVVVEAYCEHRNDEYVTGHFIYPVVSIRTIVRDVWHKLVPCDSPDYTEYSSGKRSEEKGYTFLEQEMINEVLFVDGDGLSSYCNKDFNLNSLAELVTCPWPQECDQERLRTCIDQLEKKSIQARVEEERNRR